MKYNVETIHAQCFRGRGTDLDTYNKLLRKFYDDPRFHYGRQTQQHPRLRYPQDQFSLLLVEDHAPIIGEVAINKFLTPNRIDIAHLAIEQTFTPVDARTDHPIKHGWRRDLDIRRNQYGEDHAVVADYHPDHEKRASEGPVYTSYRGFNAKLSTPDVMTPASADQCVDVFTVPVDISGNDINFWDGVVEIVATNEKSDMLVDDGKGDWIPMSDIEYEQSARHRALILGTMAFYWEVDRAIHDRKRN